MAVMSDGNRAECSADYIRTNDNSSPIPLTKAQLRAAIDAVDQWCSDNASSFNNTLPTAAKNNLTAAQKARLLAWVVLKRHTSGS